MVLIWGVRSRGAGRREHITPDPDDAWGSAVLRKKRRPAGLRQQRRGTGAGGQGRQRDMDRDGAEGHSPCPAQELKHLLGRFVVRQAEVVVQRAVVLAGGTMR